MFNSIKLLAAGAVLAYSATVIPATNTELCAGFVPQNDMKIPVGNMHVMSGKLTGITEQVFNKVMDRIDAMYTNQLKQKGKSLTINRLWSDGTVNASAQQSGNSWIINMYGGLARHSAITYEGMALVACHEMGHHMGGAPKINSFGGAWATNEGGSDYFATLKCLREFFALDDNAAIVKAANIDPLVRTRCTSQFTTAAEQDLCMRISLASESVAYLFADLSKDKSKPSFSTPDPSKVSRTNDQHPATQCRMDTYFAGLICTAPLSTPPSDTDFKVGSCVEGVDQLGFRPRCWFNPDSGGGGGGDGGGDNGTCPFGDQSICDQLCQIQPDLPFCPNVTVY